MADATTRIIQIAASMAAADLRTSTDPSFATHERMRFSRATELRAEADRVEASEGRVWALRLALAELGAPDARRWFASDRVAIKAGGLIHLASADAALCGAEGERESRTISPLDVTCPGCRDAYGYGS